jgi:hypothetical protein
MATKDTLVARAFYFELEIPRREVPQASQDQQEGKLAGCPYLR